MIKVTANKWKRTFTIRKNGSKYRTTKLARDEFEEMEYMSENDWSYWLRNEQGSYYIVKPWFKHKPFNMSNQIEEINKCLIINFDNRPKNLDIICNKYETMASEGGLTYEDCAKYKSEVEKIGYTLEYGLDSEPCNLLKID